MPTITPEQRQAIAEAGDAPVELSDPQTGGAYVLLPAEAFRRMSELLNEIEDRIDHEAWADLARRARNRWAEENPW